ncbi:MAG TPA: exodeoxyribonuclease III [Nannocystis exedens]|nr:exodeoxyribonuclease III [Nannocystis exedens]
MTPLRLLTWNVNSVRMRLDHVLTYLAEHEPDVVCLQETKVEDKLFPRVPFMELGYHVQVHGGKTHAGVATLSKQKPDTVVCGFREGEEEKRRRVLMIEVDGVAIYNLYVPNGTKLESDAFTYKLNWFKRLRAQLDNDHRPEQPVILCGDFNIAPTELDVYSVEAMTGKLHFTDIEHAALADLLAFGLRDCYRKHEPKAHGFTWFDYRGGSWRKRQGLRIDHVYATAPAYERCTQVAPDEEPRGWQQPSDHLPLTAVFE